MEAVSVGEDVLLQRARDTFQRRFGRAPRAAAAAPGRINLCGDHVDYCGGHVLPAALPFLTVIVGAPNSTDDCRVVSIMVTGEEVQTTFPTPSSAPLQPGSPPWANYIKGVVAHFPGAVEGFDAAVVSDVPMGSGLSSSASLEVAVCTLLEGLTHTTLDPVQKAVLCQKAEHEFPGMPCGIMDQYVVTMARKNHALLIDCRSLAARHVPLQTGDAVILVINSNVKHQLTGSEYPQRRAQCQEAADRLGLDSLREATFDHLEELKKQKCDEVVIMRATHVIGEISTTVQVADALDNNDLTTVGELFYRSHDSLSRLMEVSCPQLDQIVDIVRGAAGVYGARMTGGGFAGCVIVLVARSQVAGVKRRVVAHYSGTPTFFVCEPSDGARLLFT